MINRVITSFSFAFITCISTQSFAADSIKITVKTNEKDAAAIGFVVDGKKYGGLGRFYSSKAPGNKEFRFGYRKNSAFGQDVDCGSMVIPQDSTIILVNQDTKCTCILG